MYYENYHNCYGIFKIFSKKKKMADLNNCIMYAIVGTNGGCGKMFKIAILDSDKEYSKLLKGLCNSAKEYRKRTSVRKIMSYLSNDFFEISRGQVININKVVEIKKDDCSIIMKNKDKVFASKKRLNELINILDRNACGYKG